MEQDNELRPLKDMGAVHSSVCTDNQGLLVEGLEVEGFVGLGFQRRLPGHSQNPFIVDCSLRFGIHQRSRTSQTQSGSTNSVSTVVSLAGPSSLSERDSYPGTLETLGIKQMLHRHMGPQGWQEDYYLQSRLPSSACRSLGASIYLLMLFWGFLGITIV